LLILSVFLDKKSSQYFLRKTHFKMTIFEFFRIFKSPANGGGGRGVETCCQGALLLRRRSYWPFPLFFSLCLAHRGGFAPRWRFRVLWTAVCKRVKRKRETILGTVGVHRVATVSFVSAASFSPEVLKRKMCENSPKPQTQVLLFIYFYVLNKMEKLMHCFWRFRSKTFKTIRAQIFFKSNVMTIQFILQ
jgi:hypothetical protein